MAQSALAERPVSTIHILLVEDNPGDAFLFGSLLNDSSAAEYKMHYVRSEFAAIATLAEETFDVCLLELTLPDASGFSALINIQEKAPDMPVLILTGMHDTTLAKRAVSRGAQDYLLKDELELTILARAIDYAMERKRAEKELFQRANYDVLTGLANRELFMNRLKMVLSRSERLHLNVAVLYIDLDHFKAINDIYGQEAGDETLRTVAQRIRTSLRSYDTPARLGGDEFAILLEGIDNPRDVATVAQKCISLLANSIPYHGKNLQTGASIGIAFVQDSTVPEVLLQYADTAMYHAKKEGGNAYHFYAPEMHKEATARLAFEEELRAAIIAQQLKPYYQPSMSPNGKKILGVEALLRWEHTGRGLLSAHEFLPVAEAARLMPEIGKLLCAQVQKDMAIWNMNRLPPLNITLNLSTSQLDVSEITKWLAPLAQKELLGKHRLAVEIPEEAVALHSPMRIAVLNKISQMGIELHLDHFGRGSLSLTALHSLPFCVLKIDTSLIQNMSNIHEDNILIRAVILLTHHLGMEVAAVGIENPWQMKELVKQGCDRIQGFLLARPMTAEELVEWLKERMA